MASIQSKSHYAFCCRTRLALAIADRYATAIPRNVFTSGLQPLIEYQELERTATFGNWEEAAQERVRQELLDWVAGCIMEPEDCARAGHDIVAAPPAAFKPVLWKINMSTIAPGRIVPLNTDSTVFTIRDLTENDFEVVTHES